MTAFFGLDRRELRAWAFYDWANSAMVTTVMTAVFPIYFVKVAGAHLPGSEATQRLALANTVALAVVAVLAPVLGAAADRSRTKKRCLAGFASLGIAATAALFFVGRGDAGLATALYVAAAAGLSGSIVFYESLLPHVARPEELHRVSAAGYALGYLGGGLLLAVNLLWITKPAWFGLPSGEGLSEAQATLPARLSFLSAAVWWAAFTVPLLRWVPEPPAAVAGPAPRGAAAVRTAFAELWRTLRELRAYRPAFVMLIAFLVYNDGIQTIQKMATAYGTELGIAQTSLLGALLLVQFVGVPCSILFGRVAHRVGAKRAVYGGLAVYGVVACLGYVMTNALHFFVLAALVGLVQGGTQAISRSLFAGMIPRERSGEFFGFYGVAEKFAGLFGPLLFALAIEATGSSRQAVLSVIVFFVAGAAILRAVRVEPAR